MISKEQIEQKIKKHQNEIQLLRDQHAKIVADHQEATNRFTQTVTDNQNRFQQLTGAVAQLQELLNGSEQGGA